MRIVAGKFGGRRLATPSSDRIRPTTDRTRESLFSILGNYIQFEGLRVLDLFAGTGALGLEALSRGADFALFVETGAEGRGILRENIENLGLQGATRIFKRDATKIGPRGNIKPFDLVFLDPPYARGLGEQALEALIREDWLADGATLVLEEASDSLPELIPGYEVMDRRKFGSSAIAILGCRV